MDSIDIIYLTFNRLDLNKKSLPALLECDPDVDYKVYIHDNGSKDGTVEWLKSIDHPKIAGIHFNEDNVGIAPVTNKFWSSSNATYLGKIDNDVIVPKNWIKEVMQRLENAQEERVGPVTLYHWIDEWSNDINLSRAPVVTLKNGSKLLRSSHTGGNYIMHRYLVDELGLVDEGYGLKGGFTRWQWQAGRSITSGYVYPFRFFRIPELYKSWEGYVSGKAPDTSRKWVEKERNEAKRLLEIIF